MKTHFSNRSGISDGKGLASPDDRFREPDLSYAPHAFWFWNSPEELKSPAHFAQMARDMSNQGLNPGYVHARYYKSQTPFWLSDDWYACFEATVEATEQAAACVTYTMGDPSFPDKYFLPDHPQHPRFPVGGAPLPKCPDLRSVSLTWTIQDVQGGVTTCIPDGFFAVVARHGVARKILSSTLELVQPGSWTAPSVGEWRVFSFSKYHEICQYGINFLDRRLAEPWLKLENEKYERLFSRHFGKTMQGVFFDLEGSYGHKMAWSEDLAKDYLASKGVDIRLRLPLLIEEDTEGLWAKARWDWFDVVGRLYADCLFNPLDQWCRDRGMFMTCHFWEENLFLQAAYVANFMGAQRSYSMPGTDALFRTIHDPRYFKETQSVCEFEGRQFMCELLGIAGWHVTPAEMKTAVNSAVAQGLTHLIPHGINSSRELSKVSYPPDFFDWNPYWRYLHLWNDFSRRACHVNDHGRIFADTLLFCPMDSVWALIGDGFFDRDQPQPHIKNATSVKFSHSAEVMAIDEHYSTAIKSLFAARIDHLVADSHYLEMMTVKGSALVVGAFSFSTLILPTLRLLPLVVAQRIVDFAQAGGQIYALGSLPDSSAENGVGDPEMKSLMDLLRNAPTFFAATDGLAPLIAAGTSTLKPCVVFEYGAFPLIASRRETNGRCFLWLANNEPVRHEFVLRVPGASGEVAIWDCETGHTRVIFSEDVGDEGDSSKVALTLAPYEAFWLVIDPSRPARAQPTMPVSSQVFNLASEWHVQVNPADQPNQAQYRLAAPNWLLKGERRPLESWLKWELREFSGFVDYVSEFEMDSIDGREILDLGEVLHVAEVWVNGLKIGERLWAPFEFQIGASLLVGKNSIRVRVGNLIINALTQYKDYNWKWFEAPHDEALDAGLFGPVAIRRQILDPVKPR